MMAYLNQLDTQLFLFLNSLHLPFLDPVMILISGKLTWIPLYLLLLVLIIRYFKWQSVMILLFVALLITVSDQVSVKIFKYVFERPRPCHEPDLEALIHLPTGNCGGAYGFISSHAANSFALAGFLFLLLRRRVSSIGIILFTYAFLVSYSRIYIGVHYPGDVIAGGLVGIIISVVVWFFYGLAQKYYCQKAC
ncbi:MAG: phosphatase PAP2 family protein [Bacteroidales bacterium]|nr:phosphatase PAP2 family protein [Bacteroidales bacterium]